MSTFTLLASIVKQIDKYKKTLSLEGFNINARKSPKATWKNGFLKEEGGL
jgi:hypothetical protein